MKARKRVKRFVYVRCSKSEKREWQRLAEEEGLSLAGLIHSLLASAADEEIPNPSEFKQARKANSRMCANEKLFFNPYEKQMRE